MLMIQENFNNQENQTIPQAVIDRSENGSIHYRELPEELPENVTNHFLQKVSPRDQVRHKFLLLKTIGDLHYRISLGETYGGHSYILSFKTDEYEYAKVRLTAENSDLVYSTLAEFVRNCSQFLDQPIERIEISAAPAAYRAEEIEQCLDKIVSHPDNKLTREEIASRYKGFEVFDFYQELFGEDFHPSGFRKKSLVAVRSRLFKMIAKHFPDCEIESGLGYDFYLVPKAKV